ncbi:UPF0175 family protein [Candidatus Parcubacteria bacterium]|nr:MAG: UPF0175 family protein [Candidatus Parcubacteria bacterium]
MPLKLLEDVDILVEQGVYTSKDELLDDAIRALLRTRPELRQELALALYTRGRISLTRAAEMAGLDIESFKDLLHDMGVPYRVSPVGKETVREEIDILRKPHSSNGG